MNESCSPRICELKAGMTKQRIFAVVTGMDLGAKFHRVRCSDETGAISITCFKRHLVEKLRIGDIAEFTCLSFSTWKSALQACPAFYIDSILGSNGPHIRGPAVLQTVRE